MLNYTVKSAFSKKSDALGSGERQGKVVNMKVLLIVTVHLPLMKKKKFIYQTQV